MVHLILLVCRERAVVPLRPRLRKPRGIARHQIDLDMDGIALLRCAPGGDGERMRDQQHGEDSRPSTVVDGQRGAVEADRALDGDEARRPRGARMWKRAVAPQARRRRRSPRVARIWPTPSTWPVTRWPPSSSPTFSERSRLIARARLPVADAGCSPASRLRPRPGTSRAAAGRAAIDRRQADAGAGDRGADLDRRRIIGACDAEPLQARALAARPRRRRRWR